MIKSKILRGFMAFAATVPLLSYAADWAPIGSMSENQASVFIDAGSIRFSGTHAKAWFLYNYGVPVQITNVFPAKAALSAKQLFLFDCDQQTIASAQAIFTDQHDGDGNVISTWSIPPASAQYSDVIPDSVGEVMLRDVCATRPSKKSPM